MKKQPPKYKLRIAELELDLMREKHNLDSLRAQINHVNLKAIESQEETNRANEYLNKWRGKHHGIIEEVRCIHRFISDIGCGENDPVFLQRSIGMVQGHLSVIVSMNKQPQIPTLKEYAAMGRSPLQPDSADALLYGLKGRCP